MVTYGIHVPSDVKGTRHFCGILVKTESELSLTRDNIRQTKYGLAVLNSAKIVKRKRQAEGPSSCPSLE